MTSVDAALALVRQYLERPAAIFEPEDALAPVSHLWTAARDAVHEKAPLSELEKHKESISADVLRNVMLGLLGEPVKAKVGKEVTGLLKSKAKAAEFTPRIADPGRQM